MARRKKQEIADFLQEKMGHLVELKDESDLSIGFVKGTIDNLGALNADIQQTRDEIISYIQGLEDTQVKLGEVFEKNQRIMQNFKELLCME